MDKTDMWPKIVERKENKELKKLTGKEKRELHVEVIEESIKRLYGDTKLYKRKKDA